MLAALGAMGFRWALRREQVRLAWDRFVLGLPLAGRLVRAANTARAARTLATLTASGVPVLDAHATRRRHGQAAADAAGLPPRRGARARGRRSSRARWPTAGSSRRSRCGSIASGEKSGKLDAMLEQAARHQAREVEVLLGTLTTVLGPAVILVVGGMVLFIVLAILLPIFELNTLIK